MGKIPLIDRSCIRTAGPWYTTHATAFCAELWLSRLTGRGGRSIVLSLALLTLVAGWPPGQVMKRSNLNVVGPPIKVFVERRVLDVVLWPPRIVMLSVMLPQDRLISTISSVCAKDPLYWLPRMPGPGRPTYSPYSVAIPNRAAPACCPQAV